jgi:hypothetical protein
MQRRIAMIARFDRRQTARPLAAAVLSIFVAGAAFAVPTFAQEKPAPPPIQAPPAVDQARQAIEAAAAKPAPSVAPEPPNVPEPLAPPPVATTPPPPASAQVGRPFPDGPPNGFRQSATERPAPAIQDKRSANEFGAGPRSIEDASSTAANFKTMERLKQPHPLDSQGVPLRDVLRMIADLGKLDIVTDDQALSDALNAPVNMTVHEARPLEQLLEMSLRLAGPQVDYTVLNGVIFVSSRSELNGRVVTRVYDVGNADHDAITDLLTNGTGLVSRVSFAGNKLVITASELTQRHVAKLLSAVSDQMSQHRVGQAMRGLGPDDTTIHALRFAEAQSIKQVVQSACSPNVKIMVDSRTNSMIITGGGDDQKLAAAIIAKLDVPPVERTTAQPAEDTMTKLRALAELALKMSERYGAHSKQLEDVGKQVDTLGNEVSTWIDRLAKDGKLPEAEKLRSELDQIKTLLAPLAKEVQGNRPPEPTRPETAR